MVVFVSSAVFGDVRRVGDWSQHDRKVTLSVKQLPRSEALRRLADKAGWSLVVISPSNELVGIHAKNQPPIMVLEALLADGRYVANRKGSLIRIAQEGASESKASSQPAADERAATSVESPASSGSGSTALAPAATDSVASQRSLTEQRRKAERQARKQKRRKEKLARKKAKKERKEKKKAKKKKKHGDDRFVTGGSETIEADEVIGDMVVLGGAVELFGTITGDLVVVGGSAILHEGAEIYGDAVAVGGVVDIADGARVSGDLAVFGGDIRRHEGAVVNGDSVNFGGGGSRSWLSKIGGAMTGTALLFVFGVVLLALASRRMERLQVELAARPARCFGLGIVGALGALGLFIALCITVIGIPVALVALLVSIFAIYASMCAGLTATGAALVRHRSTNPYVHLAVGCLVYLVVGFVPFVGGLFTAALVLAGIGVLVATRLAGFVPRRKRDNKSEGPYRTPASA